MLNDLQDASGLLTIYRETEPFGVYIKIKANEKIAHNNHIVFVNDLFYYSLTTYFNGEYLNLYLELDSTGNILKVLKETEGMMPTLFIAPNNSVWCTLGDTEEKEIILPLSKRQELGNVKKYRPFVGEWLGTFNNMVLFYTNDSFGNKPDQLMKLEFKDNSLKKREVLKIDKPINNKMITQREYIQMIAWDKGNLLHRKMDFKGNIIQERSINVDDMELNDVVGVRLSFDEESTLIGFNDNTLFILFINSIGGITKKNLIELEATFYNILDLKIIDTENNLVSFVGEEFNGWALINNNIIAECFVGYEGNSFYKDIISDKIIEFPKRGNDKLVISGIGENKSNTYQVVIYNQKEEKELYIISRNF
ncbi:hypothetical protein [Mesobacillus subterraneus]|uniref:Uncharacterized protein n=1 Tax=Mesobacillus subterraneus TaxID=285983 RepID=A0A3R9EAZ6_9BACI|nr:hypothetical protein [Mesobacillus subterraneus]RSD27803.1 hypothetical protein EJA10_08490 [Mesobacillus subterraneus]